jgi:hypothetical protein
MKDLLTAIAATLAFWAVVMLPFGYVLHQAMGLN